MFVLEKLPKENIQSPDQPTGKPHPLLGLPIWGGITYTHIQCNLTPFMLHERTYTHAHIHTYALILMHTHTLTHMHSYTHAQVLVCC